MPRSKSLRPPANRKLSAGVFPPRSYQHGTRPAASREAGRSGVDGVRRSAVMPPLVMPVGAGVMVLVLMGVSGSGKTTVGEALAAELGWTFVEADDFHPTANVEKMRNGLALDDDDRRPWLRAL